MKPFEYAMFMNGDVVMVSHSEDDAHEWMDEAPLSRTILKVPVMAREEERKGYAALERRDG
jgi:hypothetical protein